MSSGEATANVEGVTIANGKVEKIEKYSISLKLGRIRNNLVKLQKETVSGWEDINEGDDLLKIDDPLFTGKLRIIVEDNTSLRYVSGRWPSRGDFYSLNSRVLNSILNFSIPLRLEVRKYHNDRQERVEDVKAVISIIDPREDIEHVNGIFNTSELSRSFIKEFNQNIASQPQCSDNCPKDLAPSILEGRCRGSNGVVETASMRGLITASMRDSRRRPTVTYGNNEVSIDSGWSYEMMFHSEEEVDEYLIFNIEFKPPFILGDNYKLRISLRSLSNEPLPLKSSSGEAQQFYETPPITIWRMVKINLIIQNDINLYDKIDWDTVRKAYEDSYIEVDIPQKNSNRVHVIPIDEWINYLDRFVYSEWRRSAWNRFRSQQNQQLQQDLRNYSFPQKLTITQLTYTGSTTYLLGNSLRGISIGDIFIEGVTNGLSKTYMVNTDFRVLGSPNNREIRWLPEGLKPDVGTAFTIYSRLAPEKDRRPADREILTNLTKGVVEHYIMSHSNAERCFYILICRPPSNDPSIAGRYVLRVRGRGAAFVTIREERSPVVNAHFFIHELGHGLFLKHGVVEFVENYESNTGNNVFECIAVEAGIGGPYWELHDSEHVTSCVMSYPIRLIHSVHDEEYSILKPSIDRCFCGVCLLLLRFYDEERLRRSIALRKIQYSLREGGSIKIAYTPLNTVKPISREESNLYILSNPILNSQILNMNIDEEYIVFALYPMEEIRSREGDKIGIFKDISTSSFRLGETVARGKWGRGANIRGRWKIMNPNATDPNTAVEVANENRVIEVSEHELEDEVRVARIKAVREGSNKLYFGIEGVDDQGQTRYIWSLPLTINVSIPPPDMVITEEEAYGEEANK